MNNNQNQNETKTIKIDSLNINGEGITILENIKYCINGVLPGEEVKINIEHKKNNFVRGSINKIISNSSQRILPPCKYYGKCGGCNFQFVNYDNSLQIKKQILQNYFKDLYDKDIKINSSKNCFNYRNKASFYVKNGKIGFQKENTNEIVEINECLILNPLINRTLKILKAWVQNNINEQINYIVVRTIEQKLTIVVVCKKRVKNINDLVNGLKNELFEGNFGVYLNINNDKNKIMSNNFIYIYGLKLLETSFEKLKYYIHPNSFMQVNDEIKNQLYLTILENIKDNEIVIEGYSGSGLLSALMSTKAKKVFAVEINKNSTIDANKVKEANNLYNLENINGDCKDIIPKILQEYPDATFVIDPARSGCDIKTLTALKQSNVNKIIYISCNPYSLKQNIVFLGQNYKIKELQIFDMFPQTFHMEVFAYIERIN